jgi:hypothetical protein
VALAEDRKSGEGPKAGAVSPEAKPADPSYWDGLLQQVRDGWVLEHIGAGKRHEIGRFEAIRMLGEGGFGLVLLARDPDLDREVALKLCRVPQPGADEAILREAQLLAKISHPNVITVHETGRYGDDVFYVMERIVGMNGHRFIRRSKGWEHVIEVYIEAGTGLAVAHEHGILHGDFKPGNILIPEDGGPVRVADFGLAQMMFEDGAGTRHRLGTLPYMAPELLRGEPGDARSDQWSFCVALWHTLEAALPYEGETASELREAIELGEPLVAEPWVPERVRAILRVGLSLDPKDRYPDMRTLLRELGKLLQAPAVAVADERLLEVLASHAAVPAQRGWRVVSLAALIGAVVSALVVVVMQPSARVSVEATRDVEVPGVPVDPVIAIMASVREDDFARAEALWRETWSSTRKTRALGEGESVDIALACLGRAKVLKDRDQAKADEAVELAEAISGRLKARGRDAGSQIDVAIDEYYVEAARGR